METNQQTFLEDGEEDSVGFIEEDEGELDYCVTFESSPLGLELSSNEDGYGCIIDNCNNIFVKDKVIIGSKIIKINERWMIDKRFEEIRDTVISAARQPPVNITFRVRMIKNGTV